MNEWQEYKLGKITELIVDCPHSTPKWTNDGVIVLRNQNIRNGRLDLTTPSFTDENGYFNRTRRAIIKAGDLVFTREAPMGEICQIPNDLRCCLGQRMVLIRANKEYVDSSYLLYAMQGPFVQHQINWNEGTGTTVSNIRIPNIKAFLIPTPPISEQKAIAHILGSLDDKIELNRKMNETLEAMAQALFKSWFVDFDPVIDNALAAGNEIPEELHERAEIRVALGDERKPLPTEIRNLFPSEFIQTDELGWIPKGWKISSLVEIIELIGGGTPKTSISEYWDGNILRYPRNFCYVKKNKLGDTFLNINDTCVKSYVRKEGKVLWSRRKKAVKMSGVILLNSVVKWSCCILKKATISVCWPLNSAVAKVLSASGSSSIKNMAMQVF